jgi:hypothetical protein
MQNGVIAFEDLRIMLDLLGSSPIPRSIVSP